MSCWRESAVTQSSDTLRHGSAFDIWIVSGFYFIAQHVCEEDTLYSVTKAG